MEATADLRDMSREELEQLCRPGHRSRCGVPGCPRHDPQGD